DLVGGLPSGPEFDQLRVHGTIEIGNSSLQLSLGFTPAFGSSYVIIDNIGAASVTGTFAGLPEGGLLTTGGVTFQITYQGGMSSDVVLTRVHPPSTISSIVCDTNSFKVIQGVGESNLTYTVQATTNLTPVIQWTTLGPANANTNGFYQFIDMDAPIFRQRFYRILSP